MLSKCVSDDGESDVLFIELTEYDNGTWKLFRGNTPIGLFSELVELMGYWTNEVDSLGVTELDYVQLVPRGDPIHLMTRLMNNFCTLARIHSATALVR
jgi:hypothetical protein